MVHARRVIVYVNQTGCPWRYLPNEFPPWRTVYGYSARCCGTCPAAAPASGRPGLLQDTPASSPPGPPAWRFQLEIVRKRDAHAFEVLPRRWVVERTLAGIIAHRRCARRLRTATRRPRGHGPVGHGHSDNPAPRHQRP